ncbi:complex I subunit 5 family protein [Clostridium sp. MSJ-11]|uniref:Complex I subunit 5 family protein n=1 Tax=Clostridium mobile TaxID=2841512 RepID=A0ABS6EEE4_9CLOT|nr:complex I subunit 5 family protein [Clostridium mobile]MBU5482845.1 complex I subunit 5 family protein [Clostridium mobile]
MTGENSLLFIILFPLISTIISYLLGRIRESYRDVFNIFSTFIMFIFVSSLYLKVLSEDMRLLVPNIMGTGLYLKLNAFRYIFVWLTTLIWFLVIVYSISYMKSYKDKNRYYVFFMLTYWSTLGVFISEDLLNLFTFFEIMSLTSYPLIIHEEEKSSHEAGDTYIIMAVAGGLVLLMGLFLLYDFTQTLLLGELKIAVSKIGDIKYLIASLILFGFGVKAGAVPLHIWLPKAHPAAPAPASAILSGILLKTGIFGIMITTGYMFPDDFNISSVILVLGFTTMFIGGLLALFQRNIKRTLAYSSMSQMGYILVGIGLMGILGEHKAIAFYGTLYHIINHVIYKVLLFLAAGAVYMCLHRLDINSILGFGKNKNIFKYLFLIGLCGIIGMPGFNGFISKNLLHHALAEALHIYGGIWLTLGEYIFVISSGFTTAYMLKLFVAIFMEGEDKYSKEKYISKTTFIPMVILALLILFIGVNPQFVIKVIEKASISFGIYGEIPIDFYSIENIKSSFVSIGLGVLVYILFIRKHLRVVSDKKITYINTTLSWFSIEKNIYIPLFKFIFRILSFVLKVFDEGLIKLIYLINDNMKKIGNVEIKFENDVDGKLKELLNKKFSLTGYKLSSITYSIYIFGVMLLVILITLMY